MGEGIMIRCPFHGGGNEHTPSCSVSTKSPVWFCHACQEGGHLSRLLQGLGMPMDLAKKLIDESDFSVGMLRGPGNLYRDYRGPNPYKGLYILDDDILNDWKVEPTYLMDRFSRDTLRHFEVGFDYGRDRIIFPIRNIFGDLVGVSGRTTIGEEPRYKIYKRELQELTGVPSAYSLESVKKFVLWHGHLVLPELFKLRPSGAIIIVEGFKAAMAVWEAGFSNVVALLGAYASEGHADLLASHGCGIILFLDNNKAGIKGTWKAAKRFTANPVFIAEYPDLREQPDDLNTFEIQEAIENASTPLEWKRNNDVYVQNKEYTYR